MLKIIGRAGQIMRICIFPGYQDAPKDSSCGKKPINAAFQAIYVRRKSISTPRLGVLNIEPPQKSSLRSELPQHDICQSARYVSQLPRKMAECLLVPEGRPFVCHCSTRRFCVKFTNLVTSFMLVLDR